ncbi:MAG TPA: c-type cytochrome biogenesis protein CcsB [Pseudonocardiaceae bacterium]|jgi:cytochrome c-type biogenesis protein CcsB|nr:c-type cytochrome biogenesis protein CcsB [Pseudonocardiaceae bacterium]
MPVNEHLAQYSNWAYTSTVVIYVLAMFFYLGEQALTRARTAATAPAARQLVTAGGATVTRTSSTPTEDEGDTGRRGERPTAERLGRMAVALTLLGLVVHVVSIVVRGLAVHRWPLGNMYEFISFFGLIAICAWLFMARKFAIRRLGAFVLLPVLILMFLGGTVLYAQAEPVQPALQSYWLIIHVTVVSAASGILLVPGVASVMYLMRGAHDRNPERFVKFGPKLPTTSTLDRLAYRSTIVGFPLFTFGVICGAIWAESAWGRFWGWDPKETTAFIAWVVYAAYLHSRATAGWRGNRAAIINILGFGVMIFNLFFVNFVDSGLHSYAGVGS